MQKISLPYLSLIALLAITLLPSCTHKYYAPTTHNVPMLTQKNDVRAAVGLYGGEEAEAVELQGAFATGDHVAVMLNGSLVNLSDNDDDPLSSYGKGGYLEGAVGYFKPNETQHTVFETFAGFGSGVARNGYGSEGNSNLKFNKYFVQSSIGYKRRLFEIGLSMRVGFLNYYNIQTSGPLGEPESTDIAFIRSKSVITVLEPALVVRVGPPNVKLQLQHGRSFSLSGSKFAGVDPYLSLGVLVQVPKYGQGK